MIESIILVSNYSDDSKPNEFVYSTKQKGAGYQQNNSGVHTKVYAFDQFKGAVKLQGTLALYPGEADWFDIPYSIVGGDSTVIPGAYYTVIGGDSSIIPASYASTGLGSQMPPAYYSVIGADGNFVPNGPYPTILGGDSTIIPGHFAGVTGTISDSTITCSLVGKFVWIRAAYLLEEGTIVQIRYNV